MTVNYEIDGAVGVVTLAKPPHNLLDDALLEDLMPAYVRHFCAGAEVQSFGTTTVMAVPKRCAGASGRDRVGRWRARSAQTRSAVARSLWQA